MAALILSASSFYNYHARDNFVASDIKSHIEGLSYRRSGPQEPVVLWNGVNIYDQQPGCLRGRDNSSSQCPRPTAPPHTSLSAIVSDISTSTSTSTSISTSTSTSTSTQPTATNCMQGYQIVQNPSFEVVQCDPTLCSPLNWYTSTSDNVDQDTCAVDGNWTM